MEPGWSFCDKAVTTIADEDDGTHDPRHRGLPYGIRAPLVFESRCGGVYARTERMFE